MRLAVEFEFQDFDAATKQDQLLQLAETDIAEMNNFDKGHYLIANKLTMLPSFWKTLLTKLLADPDLAETKITFLSFDLLDSEVAMFKFRETLLDYSELTTTKLSASAEVELEFELRLTSEAEQLVADVAKLESRVWHIDDHLDDELLQDLAADLESCMLKSKLLKLVLADKYQHLQKYDSEGEDIDYRDIDQLDAAAALDQLYQLW